MRLLGILGLAWLCSACSLAENYEDPEGPRYAGSYAESSEEADVSRLPLVRVVTFNVQFARAIDEAILALTTEPALLDADLLLLQEMDAQGTDAIAAALRRNYVYYPGSVQKGRDFGNAVLSRWPIVEDEKLILPHKSPADGRIRIAVGVTTRTPLGDLAAYSVHTETPWLGAKARLEQAEAVLADAKSASLPAIVAGDFNTSDPGALGALRELYESAGFVWASSDAGKTAGAFTLDSTFAKGYTALDSGSVATPASDHRPAWSTLELSPAE